MAILADIPVIKMNKNQARRAYLEYRESVRHNPKADDVMLKQAYRQLSLGRRILNIYDVMRFAGVDDKGLPRLAIGQASARTVGLGMGYTQRRGERVGVFGADGNCDAHLCLQNVVLPLNTFPTWPPSYRGPEAIVPRIPPRFRPARGKLGDYHILWDADWTLAPPLDPVLLRRITGLLFAVVATWDLTELERSVLGLSVAEENN